MATLPKQLGAPVAVLFFQQNRRAAVPGLWSPGRLRVDAVPTAAAASWEEEGFSVSAQPQLPE